MKKSVTSVFLPFLVLLSLVSGAQQTWVNFTNGDAVNDLESSGTYLWVATNGGLVRYNKNTTQTIFYNKGNSGLPRNEVMSLAADPSGTLWLVTEAGLSSFDGNSWTAYDSLNQSFLNNINDVAIESNGLKWLSTNFGLVSFNGSSWTVFDTSNSGISSPHTSRVFISPTDEKWVTTIQGLERFDGNNWTLYDFAVAPYSFYNTTDMEFNDNEVFVATNGAFGQGEGLIWFDGNSWTDFNPTNSGLPFTRVDCLDLDTSGVLWLGNQETFLFRAGIVSFDGSNWTVDSTGLPDRILHLEIDASNSFYTGTQNQGLSSYDGAGFAKINTSNSGLHANGGYDLCVDAEHELRATNYMGFVHFDWQTWTNYDSASSPFLYSNISSIAVDAAGNTWIGSHDGAIKFDGTNWTRWTNSNSTLTDHFINALAVDPDNAVWVGTQSGPFRFDGNTWTNFFSQGGSNINDVFVSHDGDVWMGSPGYGLNRFDRVSTWTNYTPPSGGNFQAGALDLSGNVWFGGNNLHRFNGSFWTTFTTADGLPWHFVTALAVDSNNVVWIGTQGGLSSYDGVSFTNYLVNNSGLSGNYISDIEVDKYNNKWLGTSNGISIFNETGVVMSQAEIPQRDQSVSVFPNPAAESVELRVSGTEMVEFNLFDALGRVILSNKFENSTKIDVSDLRTGVYTISIQETSGSLLNQKLIIQ